MSRRAGMMLVLLACAVGWGWAYPTLTGPTGLIAVPTGDLPVSGIHLAADTQTQATGRSVPLRAEVIIGHGIEFGALFNPFTRDAALDKATGANVKIAGPYADGARVGVGAQYLRQSTFSRVNTEFWQGYVAWTSDFYPNFFDESNLVITLGANWTSVRPSGSLSVDAIREFVGIQVHMTDKIDLVGDYQTKSRNLGDQLATTSLAMRMNLGETLAVQGGITNAQGLLGGAEHTVFFGISLLLITPPTP